MRVGYVLDHHLQTSQTFVANELAELQRQGVDLAIVALRRGDRTDVDDAVLHLSELTVSNAEARRQWWRLFRSDPVRCSRALRRLRQVRAEVGSAPEQIDWRTVPAAVHALRGCQTLHAHFAWGGAALAYVLAALLDVPWGFTAHANDIFARQLDLDLKLRAADQVVTVCDYNLTWMREHLALTRDVDLVICGVEVPDEQPVDPEWDVVSVGRLMEKKGMDTLVEAVALLHPSHPGLRVLVAGEGPERERLAELVEERGLSAVVTLAGRISPAAALDAIARARIFCLAARIAGSGDRDSMPVVIKEAMARSVAVVATDVVAIPEMVDETCGRLVDPDDPVSLAGAIGELLADDTLRGALGRQGRRRALERFELSGEVAKLRGGFERRSMRHR